MQVILAGGSGFLGRALQRSLEHDGHHVRILTRRPRHPHHIAWQPDGTVGTWAEALSRTDVLVNLAGANLAGGRWTAVRRRLLRDSRLLATRSLVRALHAASPRPRAFLSASAVGYYGDTGDARVTESSPPGSGFLASLCVEWEREAADAAALTRVVRMRSGVVLHPSGGALRTMLLPFRLGLGGRLGSGRQYFSWIHLEDWIALVRWLADTEQASGAFNLTAPHPVSNAEFTRALARTLRRPAVLALPALALRAAFGDLASTLLTGQRVVPDRALSMGFRFRFPDIDSALQDLLRRSP